MAETITSVPANGNSPAANPPSSEVYAVFGAEPEVQAYAMAKYSRSSLSMGSVAARLAISANSAGGVAGLSGPR